ncbi:DUF2845 domain-containing protein [Solimonas marina]|uniref:DUF2845 domain-containing protein n=1 Tax=Solimonas marina TaxID=2714601 RepID=A0A969WA90_9GAMM|nr:DUF2845 domain-containing protein [Solimonas marina]NKF22769.1 DUF2845 domain-containing protein [Solimonas marina]
MKRLSILLALLISSVLLAPRPALALDTVRCGSRLVSVGMTMSEVLDACGEPSLRDAWTPAGNPMLGYAEEWTYNLGSGQLLRLLRFRNGELQRIDTDGRGFVDDGPGDCAQLGIVPGMSKYRLLASCGPPTRHHADVIQVPYDARHRVYDPRYAYSGWHAVYREHWIYDFGPDRLVRIVELEDGRVTDIEFGDRGRRESP